jgi:hypothetical protein
VVNRYVGNLPPMPGVFSDYPAPVVRNAGAERELTMMRWGMPPPPRAGGSVNPQVFSRTTKNGFEQRKSKATMVAKTAHRRPEPAKSG